MIRKSLAAGLILALLASTPAAAATLPSWSTAGGSPLHNSLTEDSLKPSLYVRWQMTLDDYSLTTPVIAEGRVYTGTFAGTVYAADAADGHLIWSYKPSPAGFRKIRGLSYESGLLYVSGTTDAGSSVVALDVTGDAAPREVWQAALPDWSASAPLVSGGVVTLGCNDGTLIALDAQTGAEKWRQRLERDFWRSNQAASGETLIALTYLGSVNAYDLQTGALRWSDALGGNFEPGSSPVIVGETVYVASSRDWAGKIGAYDLLSGARRWYYETDVQDNLWMTPVVVRGHLLAPIQGALYSLNASTGRLAVAPLKTPTYRQDGHTYRPTLHTPVVGADLLWLPATYEVAGPQEIYALDASAGYVSGPILRRSTLPSRLGSGLAYAGGVLYFNGQDKKLYAMSSVTIIADGQSVEFPDVPAYISAEGRVMVPLRFVLEATGATVDWVAETRTVIVRRGETVIQMQQDSREVLLNGEPRTMDTPVVSFEGRTVVPVRFLTEWLGGTVEWSQNTLTAGLTLPN